MASTPTQSKARYDQRKADGLCIDHGNHPPEPGLLLCAESREHKRAWLKARYHARKAAGLCPTCAKPSLVGDCDDCRAKDTARRRALVQSGVCGSHPSQPLIPGRTICSKCAANNAASYARAQEQEHCRRHPSRPRAPRRSVCQECLDIRNRSHAGQAPVVYRWVMPDGRTAYVGRGTRTRAHTHKYSSSWWTPDLTLITFQCRNEWHAMEMEGRWGQRYQPIHNIEGNRR